MEVTAEGTDLSGTASKDVISKVSLNYCDES